MVPTYLQPEYKIKIISSIIKYYQLEYFLYTFPIYCNMSFSPILYRTGADFFPLL